MNEPLVLTDSARLPGASDWEDGSTGLPQSGRLVDAGTLLTIVIELHIGNGLVRISAGMVGILL